MAEQSSCSVCLECFQEPKVLLCCHSFCLKCLEGILEKAKDKCKITCPQCRTQHQVPETGAGGFLADYTLSESPHKSTEETCKQCDENNKAVSYCNTCSDFFCDSCLQAHKRLRVFRHHKIVPIENMADTEPIAVMRDLMCTAHPKDQLKLFCQTCQVLSCVHCFVTCHNGHEVHSLDDTARRKAEANIEKKRHHLETDLKELQDDLQYIAAVEKDKMDESTQLKAEINRKVDSMIARLEARRAELVKEADDACTKTLKELWAGKEHLETIITSKEGALCFTDRVLDCKNDNRILLLCGQVTARLEELSQQKWDSGQIEKVEQNSLEWNESTSISISTTKFGDVSKDISDIELVGRIGTHEKESQIKLTRHNVPTKVVCGQEAEFQVTVATAPRNALKRVSISGFIKYGPKPHTLRSATEGTRVVSSQVIGLQSVTTTCEESGKMWTIKFTPKRTGTCYIKLNAHAWSKHKGVLAGLKKSFCTDEIEVTNSDQEDNKEDSFYECSENLIN